MTAVDAPAPEARSRREIANELRGTRRRTIAVSFVLAVATAGAFVVSVALGDFPIPLEDVIPAILGRGDATTVTVAHDLRLPRVITGMLVGGAFGVSGSIFQAVARNPLASPDILGVMFGASAAAVFAITVLAGSFAVIYAAAFLGALLITVTIYLLAYRRGVSSYRFVLIGIGVGAMALAVTMYLLTESPIFAAATATVWLAGSLNGAGWETVAPTSVVVLSMVPLALLLSRRLHALLLGDDTAAGLGVRVERSRLVLLLVAVALAGIGTAAAGPVAFVAFMTPPIARMLTRTPLTIIPAGLAGALLVMVADLGGRMVFESVEMPVGTITGAIGASYLLWLLGRTNRAGQGA